MKLLTKEIRKKLPPFGGQEDKGEAAIAYVKFFPPWGSWTWYATEGEPVLDDQGKEIDFTFFGWVDGDYPEWGYFSLAELQEVTGPWGLKIERDLYWTPIPVNQIKGYQKLEL